MLHMIVATHGPETCPGVIPELREKMVQGMQKMDQVMAAEGATAQGGWVNMPAHQIFMLVDAPNAHVVNKVVMELGFMDWNTVIVNPVIQLQEAVATAQQRSA